MFISIVVTMFHQDIISYKVLVSCMAAGAVVGFFAARLVAVTSMPEMVALFNGFGGIASLLVGMAAFYDNNDHGVVVAASILIGGVTFTGSLFAWAKLKGWGAGSLTFFGQQFVNGAFVILTICSVIAFVQDYLMMIDPLFAVVGFSLLMGILVVAPIGGADMPVVISLLNSYSGLAASAAGFVVNNNLLIVAGALVGASGIILTQIMCKAMNRSLTNVLFSGFSSAKKNTSEIKGEVSPINVDDTYLLLECRRFSLYCSWIWNGRCSSSTYSERVNRKIRREWNRSHVWNSSCCGKNARAHERATRRSKCSLRATKRNDRR